MPDTIEIPIPEGCPAHLRERTDRLVLLQRWANGIAGFYGVPVYLCGSALRDDNVDPRDWDVRLCLPDRDFTVRYGDVAAWVSQGQTGAWERPRWRWSEDCVKRTHEAWQQTKLNVDFQVYPEPYWDSFGDQPRVRLDTRWVAFSEEEQLSQFRGALHPLSLPSSVLYQAIVHQGAWLHLDALQGAVAGLVARICDEIHDAEQYAEHWPPPGGLL